MTLPCARISWMCDRSSRVSGSTIWNSSSMPMVKTCSFSFIGGAGQRPLFVRDQFFPGPLETTDHYFARTLMQFVAQSEIVFPMLPQQEAGKTKGGAGLAGARIKGPEVGREQP